MSPLSSAPRLSMCYCSWIIIYSNDFPLYQSLSSLYYGAIAINCLAPSIFYICERRSQALLAVTDEKGAHA